MANLKNMTAQEVINHSRSMFGRHNIPKIVVGDNRPQYLSDLYATFSRKYAYEHVTSSPQYPQENGEAEESVKTVMEIFCKSGDHSRE